MKIGFNGTCSCGEERVIGCKGCNETEVWTGSKKKKNSKCWDRLVNTETFCPDCKVAFGDYHHWGCTLELCPWFKGTMQEMADDQMKKLKAEHG